MFVKKHLVKIIVAILVLLLLLVISCAYKIYWLPKTSGILRLQGLHGPVVIQRDRYGVVHIDAQKNDLDAFYALGYAHAQDRLWQMVFQKHVVSGTLSKLFGKKTLKQDEFLRTWGFYRAARLSWKSLSASSKAMVESYTAGVNAFIRRGHDPLVFKLLRYQPKQWTVYDSIAWQKMMAWDLQSEWQAKLKNQYVLNKYGAKAVNQFFPLYPKNAPTTMTQADSIQAGLTTAEVKNAVTKTDNNGGQVAVNLSMLHTANTIRTELGLQNFPGKGSNSWVLAGKYTASGKPLLANDVHLALSAPSLWYLADIKGPHIHITGATIPGLPMVIIGHNDHIAWGITAGYGDTQDLYVLPAHAKITVINEQIPIKDGAPIPFKVRVSQYGPIISSVTPNMKNIKQNIALRWPALQAGDTTTEAFYKMQYAKNWQDFIAALKYYVSPTLNFLYADTAGNIGYYYAGKIPIRRNWSGRFLANTQQHWYGFIPFKQLPHVYNPPEGFLASANNKVAPSSYPYELTPRWKVPPFRVERIHKLLNMHHHFTVQDMMHMQADVKSKFWVVMKPMLLKVKALTPVSQKALVILKQWDGRYTRNSIAATIFAYWMQQYTTLWPKQLAYGSKWLDPLFLIQTLKTKPQFLSASLSKGMAKLMKKRGTDQSNWQWGKVHHAFFNELGVGKAKAVAWIWRREISTPGSNYTVDVGTFDMSTFEQIAGASYRQIIDLGDIRNSRYMITLGQSGNVFSHHYDDLLTMWRNVQYIPILQLADFGLKADSIHRKK